MNGSVWTCSIILAVGIARELALFRLMSLCVLNCATRNLGIVNKNVVRRLPQGLIESAAILAVICILGYVSVSGCSSSTKASSSRYCGLCVSSSSQMSSDSEAINKTDFSNQSMIATLKKTVVNANMRVRINKTAITRL